MHKPNDLSRSLTVLNGDSTPKQRHNADLSTWLELQGFLVLT